MDNYVDALPQDMIKWTTIIILSDRCANLFYQQICYLNLDLFSKPCYFISMIFRLYIKRYKPFFYLLFYFNDFPVVHIGY